MHIFEILKAILCLFAGVFGFYKTVNKASKMLIGFVKYPYKKNHLSPIS